MYANTFVGRFVLSILEVFREVPTERKTSSAITFQATPIWEVPRDTVLDAALCVYIPVPWVSASGASLKGDASGRVLLSLGFDKPNEIC